jgi:hypothetical protein
LVNRLQHLLFLVPIHGIIVGPLKGREGKLHECLSERLWFGFREIDMNEGLDEEAPTCNSGGVACQETHKRASSVSIFLDPLQSISHWHKIFLATNRLRNG